MPCRLLGEIAGIPFTGRRRETQREQRALFELRLAAGRAQLINQWQQDDRHVAVSALQPLDVVRQLHHTTHQRGTGDIELGDVALLQGNGELLHFLCNKRRCTQLHHPQRAHHLMQVRGAGAHRGSVGRVFGECLDLHARLAQGFIELRLDPAQRGGVDGVVHGSHDCAPLNTVGRT